MRRQEAILLDKARCVPIEAIGIINSYVANFAFLIAKEKEVSHLEIFHWPPGYALTKGGLLGGIALEQEAMKAEDELNEAAAIKCSREIAPPDVGNLLEEFAGGYNGSRRGGKV